MEATGAVAVAAATTVAVAMEAEVAEARVGWLVGHCSLVHEAEAVMVRVVAVKVRVAAVKGATLEPVAELREETVGTEVWKVAQTVAVVRSLQSALAAVVAEETRGWPSLCRFPASQHRRAMPPSRPSLHMLSPLLPPSG